MPSPAIVAQSNLTAFLKFVGSSDFRSLYHKAGADPGWFWDNVIRFADLKFYRPYDRIMDDSGGIEWTKWCVGGTTNMVLNCIDRHRGTPTYDSVYMIWEGETGETRQLTYREFDILVCKFASVLKGLGVGRGDVVGIFMPQIVEVFVAYFATVKIGAIAMPLFSGFASGALSERLQLMSAKIVVAADAMYRRGAEVNMIETLDRALQDAPDVNHVVVLRRKAGTIAFSDAKRAVDWHAAMSNASADIRTEEMDAEAPAVLHLTSGTTGKPKGAIYTHIGFAAKMILDYGILSDFKASDRYFYQADMGWMVGSQSAVIPAIHGSSMLVAEGVPDYPEPDRFWDLIDRHRVSWVGITPSMTRLLMKYGDEPPTCHALDSLRLVLTAAEPWTETAWRWLFETVLRKRVPMFNASGGTEISGCIVLCSLHHPLKVGSFSIPIPGMGADIVDEMGRSLGPGQIGELVLRRPSIGLTPGLWRDNERYLESYWRKIPGMWVHGDLASRDADGQWYIHGRSDDTMKIAGKRVGPAEIENVLMSQGLLVEAAAVAIPDPIKGSALIAVCVPLPSADRASLASTLSEALNDLLGKSFRPQRILIVDDLPKTRSMKIMRRAVRAALTGESPGDVSALSNPDAIEQIRARAAATTG